MTREAKIGMLTGLGVIVLIGVLLSDYLGDSKAAGSSPATGRMASLPIGANYRQQVLDPVTVPAMARTETLSGGNELNSPISTSMGIALPPTAYAAQQTAPPEGPVVANPVSPEAMGPATVQLAAGGPPTISLRDPATVATREPDAAKSRLSNATYVVVAGDNLGKIAKKFYNSSKQSDVQRIVAANPAILKDAATPLIVNKKLIIPGAPAAVILVAPDGKHAAPVVAKKADPMVIYLPGPLSGQPDASPALQIVAPPKKDAAKTYEIQSGDTLEKLARKYSPSNTKSYVEKLKTLNAVKDPTALVIGTKLKLPA